MFMRRAMWFGRAASGVVVAAVVLTAVALASPGASERISKEGGTFRIGVPAGAFDSIDPALVAGAASSQLQRPACSSLLNTPSKRPPAGLRYEPELATDYPVVSRSGRTYTFAIRKDARFSNGAPVLARDVVASLERCVNPAQD